MVTKDMDVEDSTRDEEGSSEGNKQNSQTTIFVGNLPFETRDDELEKEFSEIGPIKRAFIVKDKDKKSKSRGCGYVQFVLQDDADKCVKAAKSIGNRKLRLSYANKKPKHLKRKALAKAEEGEKDDTETKDDEKNTEEKEDAPPPVKSNKKDNSNNNVKDKSSEEAKVDGKTDLQKTIVLTGLTAKVKRKAFRILCEGFGEIENIVYPVPERDEVTAFVRYKEYKSAIRATQKIPGKKVKKSAVLSACLLTKENKHPSKKALQKSRLIIRNLSFKCEENDLNEVFSKFGKVINVNIPTKKVNDKDVKVGCAFVQFAHTENAKAALEEMNLKEIKGREVVVDWAVTKDVYKEKTKEESKNGDAKTEEGTEASKKKKKKKEKGATAEDSKMKETEDTSLIENEKSSKKKKKKEKEIVCEDNETETCETDKPEETKQKKKKKKKEKEEEPTEKMDEDIREDDEGATKNKKKKKNAKEEEPSEKMVEDIPEDDNGATKKKKKKKKKGAVDEEGNELETKVNGTEEEHVETNSGKKKTQDVKKRPSENDVSDEDEEELEEDLVVSDVDEGDDDEVMADEVDDDDDNDEDDSDDEEEEEEEEENADENEEDEDIDIGSDVEDGSDDDDDDEMDEEDIDAKPKREMKDAKEGKTIFIRNLSYDIDEEMLSEEFEKYGEIDYCKLVYDHETGRSKGTAFLKFKQKTFADKCLEEFEKKERSGINTVIDGRPIMVSLAVTKGKLGEMQRVKSDEKKETDKRNLYLAAEGLITRNSPAAEGLSDAELKKREKALAEKKAKLKNPNFFISRTRLCVRNLPVATDADALRVALLKHAPRNMKIIELKIMRSKDRRDISGVPRSLGYGFIELDSHEDALALLRATNNNPKIFGEARRPIVEFSVENAKALKILELKKKRIEMKNKNFDNADEEEGAGKPKFDRKALKEKIYQKKVKRFARYKRKREQKKLTRDNENVIQNGSAVAIKEKNNEEGVKSPRSKNNKGKRNKDNTRNNKGGAKNKDNTRNKTEIVPGETSDRGFKRKLPANVGQPIKRQRKFGKKKDEHEEEKFNKMVKQYKQKLFGDNSQTNKKKDNDRWFQ